MVYIVTTIQYKTPLNLLQLPNPLKRQFRIHNLWSPTSLQLGPPVQLPIPNLLKRQFRLPSRVLPTSLQLRPHNAPPSWGWWRLWTSWRRREIKGSRGSQGWPSWPTAGSLLWTTTTTRVTSLTLIYRGSGLSLNSKIIHGTWPATGRVSWQWQSGWFRKDLFWKHVLK